MGDKFAVEKPDLRLVFPKKTSTANQINKRLYNQ